MRKKVEKLTYRSKNNETMTAAAKKPIHPMPTEQAYGQYSQNPVGYTKD